MVTLHDRTERCTTRHAVLIFQGSLQRLKTRGAHIRPVTPQWRLISKFEVNLAGEKNSAVKSNSLGKCQGYRKEA